MNNVMRYIHFRCPDTLPYQGPAITAVRLVENPQENLYFLRMGLSFCSPKDQFSRPEGRKWAEWRIQEADDPGNEYNQRKYSHLRIMDRENYERLEKNPFKYIEKEINQILPHTDLPEWMHNYSLEDGKLIWYRISENEVLKRNILRDIEYHKNACPGGCGVSVKLLMRVLEKAGVEISEEEMSPVY